MRQAMQIADRRSDQWSVYTNQGLLEPQVTNHDQARAWLENALAHRDQIPADTTVTLESRDYEVVGGVCVETTVSRRFYLDEAPRRTPRVGQSRHLIDEVA